MLNGPAQASGVQRHRTLREFAPLGYLAEVVNPGEPVQVRADHRPLALHIETRPSISHSVAETLSHTEDISDLRAPVEVRSLIKVRASDVELTLKVTRPFAETVTVALI